MFNDEFNDFAKHPHVNLYPPHLKSNMEQVNSWTYNSINSGVYHCGFATKQKPYEEVMYKFSRLAWELQGRSRWIVWVLCNLSHGCFFIYKIDWSLNFNVFGFLNRHMSIQICMVVVVQFLSLESLSWPTTNIEYGQFLPTQIIFGIDFICRSSSS